MSPVIVNVSVAGCAPFPALLFDDRVLALSCWRADGLRGTASMAGFMDEWDVNAATLQRLGHSQATRTSIVERGIDATLAQFHAPVEPRQVFCTIGNYRCQILEAALDADDAIPESARCEAALASIERRRTDGIPYICMKAATAVSGPFDALPVEPGSSTLDWEVEIGVVVGRPMRNVQVEQALESIAGYCVVNDITLREQVFRHDLPAIGTDWVRSKSREGWLPCGPWLVPAWDVEEPGRLRPSLRLNGRTMQDGSASDMIFGIAKQIAYLSSHTTLQPGDLICTGTPAGPGSHHGRYLRPGDIVEAEVNGLGAQRIVCVDSKQ